MSIYAKRIDESIITPKDDRILFDAIFDNYGLIYGGSAKMSAVNKINVGAARGFIKGTEIIVVVLCQDLVQIKMRSSAC